MVDILCKIFICFVVFILTIIAFFICFYVDLIAFAYFKYNIQVLFFNLIYFAIIFIFWYVLFAKIKILKKILIFLLGLIIMYFLLFLPDVIKVFDYDTCIDTGICAEGLNIHMGGENIEQVNEENCIKYKHLWKDGKCYVR